MNIDIFLLFISSHVRKTFHLLILIIQFFPPSVHITLLFYIFLQGTTKRDFLYIRLFLSTFGEFLCFFFIYVWAERKKAVGKKIKIGDKKIRVSESFCSSPPHTSSTITFTYVQRASCVLFCVKVEIWELYSSLCSFVELPIYFFVSSHNCSVIHEDKK